MTDEQPPDEGSPNSPDRTDADRVSEEELDEVLSQASALALDLSEEVGTAEQAPPHTHPRADLSGPPDVHADLDAELRELEKLVAETGAEIDSDSDETGVEAPQPGDRTQTRAATASDTPGTPSSDHSDTPDGSDSTEAAPAAPPSDLQVPDFMAEFTQPEESAGPEPPESSPPAVTEDASVPDEMPDFMSELTQPSEPSSEAAGPLESSVKDATGPPSRDVDRLDDQRPAPSMPDNNRQRASGDSPILQEWGEPRATVLEEEESTGRSLGADTAAKLRELVRLATARLSPLANTTCDRVVTLLEVVDRPMARVGGRIRYVVGWLAVATVGTSLVVYILSLF